MNISELQKKKVCVITLGCDKNRVDAERMLYQLRQVGMGIVADIAEADIVVINTCAFIEASRQESIKEIADALEYKKHKLEKLIVVGCLPALNSVDLQKMLPGVDATLNTNCEHDLVPKIAELYNCKLGGMVDNTMPCQRILSTGSHMAYLKIADGCNNKCAYCTIPKIRGVYQSARMEDLVDEAKALVAQGVRELILVAQDVTRYGEDLYKKHRLVELIQELSKIKDLRWIRLHYCYPEFVREELVNEIANNPKVCKYMDIPIQHINNDLLKKMNRASTKEGVISLIQKLRTVCPDIAIRTSIIVGFPGEDEDKFEELIEFLDKYKLDNVGFFPYSRELNTVAYNLENQISEKVKKNRLSKLVELQTKIMRERQQERIGSIVLAVCEDIQPEYYVFRSQYDSPEIDSVIIVWIEGMVDIRVGEFRNIKLTGIVEPFDLEGEIYEFTE